jgi:hypothetical protein
MAIGSSACRISLEKTLQKYHNRLIDAAAVIQAMITYVFTPEQAQRMELR